MQTKQALTALAAMSNKYGSDPAYVLAGGGNTSYKEENVLYVKGSGTALATIKAEDFVRIDRKKLGAVWGKAYPADEAAREAAVLADMMSARVEGETRRPSVETLLHDLFPYRYVLHLHPTLVNGVTCSKTAEATIAALFPDAVFVGNAKPGYTLAALCRERLGAYQAEKGRYPDTVFLQNHGVFFAADTTEELDAMTAHVMRAIDARVGARPVREEAAIDETKAKETAALLADLYGGAVCCCRAGSVLGEGDPLLSLTPDHIVYCKAEPLVLRAGDDPAVAFAAFVKAHGYKPKVVFCRGLAAFCCGATEKEAATAAAVLFDAVSIRVYAASFGGVCPMPAWLVDFITHWEVESYRAKVSQGG